MPGDVFVDKTVVTLSSKTTGVEIRYTLDGQEPTPQSPLYTGPISLTKSATILACAYRPGTTKNPVQLSGTQATVVSAATFTRDVLTPPILTPHPNTGLEVNYCEGDWKQLFYGFDDQEPVANGNAARLWQEDVIPASNAFVTDNAGSRQKTYAL